MEIISNQNIFQVSSDAIHLRAKKIPWDTKIFGFEVAAIDKIKLHNEKLDQNAFDLYGDWVKQHSIELISCRLPHDDIFASMFLERHGFRFVEMVLHPKLDNLGSLNLYSFSDLRVELVLEGEIHIVAGMAKRAFGFERFHVDPRLNSRLADLRYGKWIENSFYDEKQILLKIVRNNDIIGFFVIENRPKQTVYWHLTALNPDFFGKKIGFQVWSAMMAYHQKAGIQSIGTTISARNTPVLNLYSKLNFRFSPPEVTLHWFRVDQS